MSDTLNIWLNGKVVAVVDRRRMRLVYTQEALDEYEPGAPLLSLRLPVVSSYYPQGIVRSFLDGLLPEGDARRAIAEELDVRASDTYGLMEALGRDSAGALIILPGDQELPAEQSRESAPPLSDTQLADLVSNLRNAPLGVGAGVRLSLAGVQDKLVLVRRADGRWALPDATTPSTHILKPSIAGLEASVQNEAFCMRFARNLGLPVAAVETTRVGQRELLIVERYDRQVLPDGTIRRIHQEDLCQALALAPAKKYQEDGGPSLRALARILDENDEDSLVTLVRAVTVNVLLGNCDAHGKNFSLMHVSPNGVRFAPLYDLMSTRLYGEQRLAMYIDRVQSLGGVSSDRIAAEVATWGLDRRFALDAIAGVLNQAREAAAEAESATPGVPARLIADLEQQVVKLSASLG